MNEIRELTETELEAVSGGACYDRSAYRSVTDQRSRADRCGCRRHR